MKKILFITLHDPGIRSGGGLATRSYIEALSCLTKGQIDICLADNCKIKKADFLCDNLIKVPGRSTLSQLLSVFTGEMHRYTKFIKKYLADNHDLYSHCIFDVSYIGGTLVDYVNSLGIITTTIHHNYQPEYFWDNRKSYLKDRIFLYHVKRVERKAYLKSKHNLFLSLNDLNRFNEVYGYNKAKNSVIGSFELANDEKKLLSPDAGFNVNSLKLVISGTLSSVQTMDALDYFLDELYPYIPDNYNIIITGRKPSDKHVKIINSHSNITLYPNPSDISVIVADGDIYICPTKVGGGVKLRIMDGLKLGLPVITHSISARGYEIFENKSYFQIFNSPASFVDSLNKLSESISKKELNKFDIQTDYYNYFSFESGMNRISEAIGYNEQ